MNRLPDDDPELAAFLAQRVELGISPEFERFLIERLTLYNAILNARRRESALAAARRPRPRSWSRALALAAALVMAFTVALLLAPPRASRPAAAPGPDPLEAARVAAVREPVATPTVPAAGPRRVVLSDGSVLYADAGARFAEAGPRVLSLDGGRCFLEVAKAAAPFVVRTPGGEARALGTKLVLDATAAALEVSVAQGRVALRGPAGREVEVAAGQTGRADAAGVSVGAAQRLSHLAGWARDLYAAAAEAIAPAAPRRSTGALVARDPQNGWETRLAVRKLHVDVHVEDGVARTTVDTTYFNHFPSGVEATFTFPVPPGATISRLAMYVNGTLMEGGVAERSHARAVYESIVHRRRDPALLEWMEGNVFKMRIFPLFAHQERRVIVSFTQELESLYGRLRYALPLEGGTGNVGRFSIAFRVAAGAGSAAAVESPTYPLTAATEDGDLVLRHTEEDKAPGRDLVVYLPDASIPPARACVEDGARYVIARFKPALDGPRALRRPRTYAVIYDASGSRTDPELRLQREVLSRLLEEWDDKDRFRLVALGTRVRPWRDGAFQPARSGEVREALKFLDGLRAIGATDLEAGLREATKALANVEDGSVVYLGDGIPTDGERVPEKLAAIVPPSVPVISIGVGRRIDRGTLAALSGATGGYDTAIDPDEPVAWRVFDLVAALNTPRLCGLTAAGLTRGVEVPGELQVSRTVAAEGEEVRVLARFPRRLPEAIVLRGTLGGRSFETTVDISEVRGGATYLPRLWARGRVERLLREGPEKHRAEITALGKRHFIATPFTSLLVLETEAEYAQHGVERPEPDRFAPYAAPPRIAVVTEPVPIRIVTSTAIAWEGTVTLGRPTVAFTDASTIALDGTVSVRMPTELIDGVLGSGVTRDDFVVANPIQFTWSATATPAAAGASGDRIFFVDEEGIIRFSITPVMIEAPFLLSVDEEAVRYSVLDAEARLGVLEATADMSLAEYRAVARHVLASIPRVEDATPATRIDRVLSVLDRWRAIDRSNAEVYLQAATALRACGAAEDLVWEVASTTIDLAPMEGSAYAQVAGVIPARALELHTRASEVEPTNPQHLMQIAALRLARRETAEALRLYDRIVAGSWQERFWWNVQEARARALAIRGTGGR